MLEESYKYVMLVLKKEESKERRLRDEYIAKRVNATACFAMLAQTSMSRRRDGPVLVSRLGNVVAGGIPLLGCCPSRDRNHQLSIGHEIRIPRLVELADLENCAQST